MKKLIILLCLGAFINLQGCATVFTSETSTIDFASEPTGARVLVNGMERGQTPLSVVLDKTKEYQIEFIKSGYERKNFVLTHSLAGEWVILNILFFLVGLVVDAATGKWNEFDTYFIKAVLEPKENK